MITKTLTIINKLGLHARAAAKFVSTASRYGSAVEVCREEQTVNGKSIMGVMMLAASKGTNLNITVEGEDEVACFQAIEDLINDKFGEEE